MIVGYTGLVGQGKTMLAVQEALRLARLRGALLVSNIAVEAPDVEVERVQVGDDGLEGIPDILDRARGQGRGVVILVDEIGIVLPARYWQQGMSIDLMWACSQSRKLGADLVFTCQHVAQLDAFLRRLTDWIWSVRAIPHPTLERRVRGRRPWFFMLGRWRPADVDTERPEKRLGRAIRRYRREWERVYDTDELVRPPDHLRGRRRRQPRSSSPVVEGEPPPDEPPAPTTAERHGPQGPSWEPDAPHLLADARA